MTYYFRIAVLIEHRGKSLLLAGDVEKSIEHQLIQRHVLPTNIDVLMAPHHGRKASSSEPWVKVSQPDYVVFTSGYNNAYRHPHHRVEQRCQRAGSQLIQTGKEGAIRFSIDQQGVL